MAELRNTTETVRSERRYWRRTDGPRAGWWPGGLLPLLGLLLTLAWGACATAPSMERDTAARVTETLSGAGFAGLSVEADGLDVSIRGAADEADHARILSIARGAVCDTWIAKELVCPTNVRLEFDAVPAEGRAHDFTFRRDGRSIVLEGEVPNESMRDQIVTAARSQFDDVNDRLRVTGKSARDGYEWAASRSWPLLMRLESGATSWKNGRFSAWGRTTKAEEAGARNAFAARTHADRLGELNLEVVGDAAAAVSVATVDRCNEGFASVLRSSTIHFRTGSATIAGNSRRVVESLAELARECPLPLDVEGHTDNIGSTELNDSLSLSRAVAVVAALTELGVDEGRLTPRGHGPHRPIADNATRAGRAKNRRIEIKVGRSD